MSVDRVYPSAETRQEYSKAVGFVGAMFGFHAGFLLHENVLKKLPQVKFRSPYTIFGTAFVFGLLSKPVLTSWFPLPPTEEQDKAVIKA